MITLTLVVVTYNEWIAYTISKFDWVDLPSDKLENCVRLLLVADPQIQGYYYEPAGVIGAITRWDADRSVKFAQLLPSSNMTFRL